VNRRFEITDDQWERLAPLLPSTRPQRGGRWRDHRQVLIGIVFRVRTGIPWRDLPERYGPWQTVYKRFARWQADGTLGAGRGLLARPGRCRRRAGLARAGRLHRGPGPPARRWRQERGNAPIQARRQQALGRSRGGLTTKLHTICDGRGRNLTTQLTPGQAADTRQLVGLVDAVRVARPSGRGRPRKRLDHLTGDRAYSSRANRRALRARHIPYTIPERDDQKANRVRKGARGGRPPQRRSVACAPDVRPRSLGEREAEDQRCARDEPAGTGRCPHCQPFHAGEMERTERKAGPARK
jgi:transposase